MEILALGEGVLERADGNEQGIDVAYGLVFLADPVAGGSGSCVRVSAVSVRALRSGAIPLGQYRLVGKNGEVVELRNTSFGWIVKRVAHSDSIRKLSLAQRPRLVAS